jgi:hypothetical protein
MKQILNIGLFSMFFLLLACAGPKELSSSNAEKPGKNEHTKVEMDQHGKQILPAARMPVGQEEQPAKARMQTEEVQ